MKKQNQWIGLAAIAAVILIFLFWNPFGWFEKELNLCPESPTSVVVGLPVTSDSLVRMYQENSRLKAQNSDLQCKQRVSELEEENAKLKADLAALKKRAPKTTKTSSKESSESKNVISSSYTAKSKEVTNIYSPEAPGAQEFCVNFRTALSGARDGGSFWPHAEADPPTSVVAEAVQNGSHTGWNIKLPPVDAITGLYGWSKNLNVIFVRADLIDKFGPTNVSMAGGMNGWPAIWPFAQKEGDYYVVHF